MLIGSDSESLLWKHWQTKGCSDSFSDLVLFYSPWVSELSKKIFRKSPVAGAELEDYIHVGTIGLIESLKRFDPNRGSFFKSFAVLRIKGIILNHIYRFNENSARRASTWTRDADRLESLTAGESEGDDLEKFINITVGLALGYMLEEVFDDRYEAVSMTSVYCDYQLNDLKRSLIHLLPLLPDKQRSVLMLHYFQQLQFKEVAELLGVSTGRVSQLHKNSLISLRNLYESKYMAEC